MKQFLTIGAIIAFFALYALFMTWGQRQSVALSAADPTGENIPVKISSQ